MVMQRVSGMTVLEKLRNHPDRDRLAVLVLTAFGGDTSVRRSLALGANGYVLKDGTADQLATAVRAVAGGLTTLGPAAAETVQPSTTPADGPSQNLTPRETQVLNLLGEGMTNRAIARRLELSERTVKVHVSRVMSKLGVQNRAQAALRARREPDR